ncbi:hypothetical protein [Bryobacter aggregatus]|uniref:hypothetical protein n=1 Tax=Bryobacter aggregatus TaxID=360054 RepID=UPI000691EF23|nr:hypothetical protein [Bryobacter aggregatus]
MDSSEESNSQEPTVNDLKKLVHEVFEEYHNVQTKRTEPAYKAELEEERRKRESMEKRLNELVEENRRTKVRAETMERETLIKSELQRLGVAKIDLAFKAVKDEIQRETDGTLHARSSEGPVPVPEFLRKFVDENPELLPARNLGGSGTLTSGRGSQNAPGIDIDSIRPGMNKDDLARVRREIARVAGLLVD